MKTLQLRVQWTPWNADWCGGDEPECLRYGSPQILWTVLSTMRVTFKSKWRRKAMHPRALPVIGEMGVKVYQIKLTENRILQYLAAQVVIKWVIEHTIRVVPKAVLPCHTKTLHFSLMTDMAMKACIRMVKIDRRLREAPQEFHPKWLLKLQKRLFVSMCNANRNSTRCAYQRAKGCGLRLQHGLKNVLELLRLWIKKVPF